MKTILIDALKNEEIGHAVLDVFETEPLPEENVLWALAKLYRISTCVQSFRQVC